MKLFENFACVIYFSFYVEWSGLFYKKSNEGFTP